MPTTPEFVRWTLALPCALKEECDPADPEQIERQLRSLRELSNAVNERRVWDGVCVAPVTPPGEPLRGFVAQEVLAAYGGSALVESQCSACPANLLAARQLPGVYAGCFGLWPLGPPTAEVLEGAIDGERNRDPAAFDVLFLLSQPRRYGVWGTTWGSEHLPVLRRIVDSVAAQTGDHAARELAQALEHACQRVVPLVARLYPAGIVEDFAWTVPAHCPRCRAPMTPSERRCSACAFAGRAVPERKRKPRGERPYVPLARFLGEQGAAEFVSRYLG